MCYGIVARWQRLLWLSQEAYIEKIAAKQYGIVLNGRFPDTPMAECDDYSFEWDPDPINIGRVVAAEVTNMGTRISLIS
jgi:hypothetical protein